MLFQQEDLLLNRWSVFSQAYMSSLAVLKGVLFSATEKIRVRHLQNSVSTLAVDGKKTSALAVKVFFQYTNPKKLRLIDIKGIAFDAVNNKLMNSIKDNFGI